MRSINTILAQRSNVKNVVEHNESYIAKIKKMHLCDGSNITLITSSVVSQQANLLIRVLDLRRFGKCINIDVKSWSNT